MVETGQSENAKGIQEYGNADRQPTPAHKEDQPARQVHAEKRNRTEPIDAFARVFGPIVTVVWRENPCLHGLKETIRTGRLRR